MSIGRVEIGKLLEWLGDNGAKAALEESHYSVKQLRDIAGKLNVSLPARAVRRDIAGAIVGKVNQRIDRPIADLLLMSSEALLSYFEEVRPSKAELLAVLNDLDFHPGSEAQKGLYKYAARQIAETGMFQRVADGK